MKIISGLRLIFLSLGLLAVGLVHAQPFPGKTIQYIIPFPAAGESDLVARYQAELSAKKYNQQMVVINRAGAGGALAWSQLNSYPADGTYGSGCEYSAHHLAAFARRHSVQDRRY